MVAFMRTGVLVHESLDVGQSFEAMMPQIQKVASYEFRTALPWRRTELIHQTISKAFEMFARLVAAGKAALAYPSVLARYAVRQVRAGRQTGCRQNSRDVMSSVAQRRHGFLVTSLNASGQCSLGLGGTWQDLLVSRRADPAAVAICRLDFCAWLARLNRFKRRIALELSAGCTTNDAAQIFGVSPARIAQVRRELSASWSDFQTT